MYSGQIVALECLVIYIFIQNRLVRGKYVITAQHSNQNDYLMNYATLKEMLAKKYGDPFEDRTLWLDDLYRQNPLDWGLAVSTGRLRLYCQWSTPKTNLILFLNGDNYQISLGIEYSSKEFAWLEEQATEQQTLDEL